MRNQTLNVLIEARKQKPKKKRNAENVSGLDSNWDKRYAYGYVYGVFSPILFI